MITNDSSFLSVIFHLFFKIFSLPLLYKVMSRLMEVKSSLIETVLSIFFRLETSLCYLCFCSSYSHLLGWNSSGS